MHMEGPQWKPPAPKPVLKKPKTGGLIDAIKKAAEVGLASQAKGIGAAIAKVAADADQTQKVKNPTATSRLSLKDMGAAVGGEIQAAEGPTTTMIAYRTRISASGSGEII